MKPHSERGRDDYYEPSEKLPTDHVMVDVNTCTCSGLSCCTQKGDAVTPEQENVRLRELLLTIQGCLWQSISVEPDPVGMKLLYDEIRHELGGGSAISGIAKHRILMPSTLLFAMR